MSFMLVLNRLDALINRVERLIAAVTGVPIPEIPPPGVPPPPARIMVPPPTVVMPQLPNRYKLFTVDLTKERLDEPLGLGVLLKGVDAPYASFMSIIEVPSPFQFKLNATDMDAIDAVVGLDQENFEITEIFITNSVGTGIAIINVEYRVG